MPSPHLHTRQPPRAEPHAIRHLAGQFPALEPLIQKPHADHKLLFRQQRRPAGVDEFPCLLQNVGREIAATPDIPHHEVEDTVR